MFSSLTQGLAGLPGSSVAVGVDPLFTVDRELVLVSSTGLRGESVSLADTTHGRLVGKTGRVRIWPIPQVFTYIHFSASASQSGTGGSESR